MRATNPSSTPPLAVQIIPWKSDEERDMTRLETAMQSLVRDEQYPVALEITGEAKARRFILRAGTESALKHAIEQLRVRYPQATFRALAAQDDPFRVDPGEAVSVIELKAGAADYLPLQNWSERDLARPGTDPLPGLLAALNVPEPLRAITQIALVPAQANWSQSRQRMAVEHPLEPEWRQERLAQAQARDEGPSWLQLSLLTVPLVLLFVLYRFPQAIPPWVAQIAVQFFLHGRLPALPPDRQYLLIGGGGVLLIGLFLAAFALRYVKQRWFTRPLYDQKLVQQKTSRMAYRCRIRLYVIGPGVQEVFSPQLLSAIQLRLLVHWQVTGHVLQAGWSWLFYMLQTKWRTHHFPDKQLREIFWQQVYAPPTHIQRQVLFQQAPFPSWKKMNEEWDWRAHQAQCRQDTLLSLIAAYRQFHLANAGYFRPQALSSRAGGRLLPEGSAPTRTRRNSWDRKIKTSSHILSVSDLAALWHLLPSSLLQDASLIEYRQARSLLIPPSLIAEPHQQIRSIFHPVGGQKLQYDMTVGYSDHAGFRFPYAFPDEFLTRHTLVAGKSGEGKSTMMHHLAMKALVERLGLWCIDPHGDLCRAIIATVPEWRLQEVVYLLLSDEQQAVGLNPLDVTLKRDRDKAIADITKAFKAIWKDTWGSRMENAFIVACRTIFEANTKMVDQDPQSGPDRQYTLLDVMHLVVDEALCETILQNVDDPFIKRWWHLYYNPLSLQQRRDIVNPVINKLSAFESKLARRIIGQSRSTLDFRALVADGNIVLLDLAKGVAGDDVAGLIGSTFLSLLGTAIAEQGALSLAGRHLLPVLVDEFQVLSGADYETMLQELRKYGLSMFLGTQSFDFLQNINKTLLPTVVAGARQFIIYRLSAKDAETIHKELGVSPEDIVNLDSHMCYVKTSHGAQQQPTFSLHVSLPPSGDPTQESVVIQNSRRFTRDTTDVDQHLFDALVRNLGAVPTSRHQGAAFHQGAAATSRSGNAGGPHAAPHGDTHTSANQTQRQGYQNRGLKWQPKNRGKGPTIQNDQQNGLSSQTPPSTPPVDLGGGLEPEEFDEQEQ